LSNSFKNSITELLNESCQFNTNDVLVNVNFENSKLFYSGKELSFDSTIFPKSIIREADKIRKESGVNSLCRAEGIVSLNVNGKDVQSPVIITPLTYTRDKVKQIVSFLLMDEERFINPFLLFHLTRELELETEKLQLLQNEGFLEDFNIQTISTILREFGLSVTNNDEAVIGNFHHHRYQIIRELEELLDVDSYSPALFTLFGFDTATINLSLDLPPDTLFSADIDHEAVFERAKQHNLVIQGPPGTGKSQVLTNILGKILGINKTTVVVSEKRVALEVIKKKLSVFGLDKLCFIATSDYLSHSFLQELKETWDYFEGFETKPVKNLRLSEQYIANLQMTLDLLSNETLIGGVSFHKFRELSSDIDLGHYDYVSNVPDIRVFLGFKSTIEKIYRMQLSSLVGTLKPRTIGSDSFVRFDDELSTSISSIQRLKNVFTLLTWDDFNVIKKKAAHCQIFENELYKKYANIFRTDAKEQKQFLKLRKKYLNLRLQVERIKTNQSHWKIIPSEAETRSLINTFEIGGRWFARIKSKRRWNELSHLPFANALAELKNHAREIETINAFTLIVLGFCKLGIEDVETEVSLIHHTIGLFSADQWRELDVIPTEVRRTIIENQAEISRLHHSLKSNFNIDECKDVESFLKEMKSRLPDIISIKPELLSLEERALLALSRNKTIAEYEGELLHSHWVRFKDRFPEFSKLNVGDISDKVSTIIAAQNTEAQLYAQSIENQLHKSFTNYHEILNTPARKLSADQKVLKSRLRKGKSILVKEFSKIRRHPSLRELYNSEAREWIQLLKPIWLSNPTQLAKCFPLKQSLFDVAIFDEASQIPLQNALGAIQRSSRIIVAGDEHQMGPSFYFKSGPQETADLLHQASYNWPKVALQHHYRSRHPDLIAFSNKHFYSGSLKAYPDSLKLTPIKHHFIENAVFIDRRNEAEAKAIARAIERSIALEKSIGIVAFSEEQLNCIWSQLSEVAQQSITDKINKNSGFFKALENVQGDECDCLFISFGYARNEEGMFHMRFGPMNTINGRKRLNVLLTRAIQSIEFFCSVRSSDFKLSDNESINLLRQWIAFAETHENSETLSFPFGLNPKVEGNQLTFSKIHETLGLAQEIVTLENVLINRGWKIDYK
jgi:hypothetical protein